jgi:hypothetical protein
MGFMMFFQLMDHIYNALIQDVHPILNPSIALKIAKLLFSVTTFHESNLTITYEICVKNWNIGWLKILGEATKYTLVLKILAHI